MIKKLLLLPRIVKVAGLMLFDFTIVIFSNWAAYCLRLSELYAPDIPIFILWMGYALIAILVFHYFGLYRAIIRYVNVELLIPVFKAVSVYSLVLIVLIYFAKFDLTIPRSSFITQGVICFLLVSGFRYLIQWSIHGSHVSRDVVWQIDDTAKKILIYGAGEAGYQLAHGLKHNKMMKVLGFIDDAEKKQGRFISGLNVFSPQNIDNLVNEYDISEVLLALPSASRKQRNRIITQLEPLPVYVRTLPALSEIISGKVKVEDIREVDVTDLLGRAVIPPNAELMARNIRGKSVLVTGAGGSIGSELCRQISELEPERLILLEQSEFNLYSIDSKLDKPRLPVISVLGSIEDKKLLQKLCLKHNVQTIFHAAAYKHVPLVEMNPFVGVRNNVFGTYNVAKIATETEVENMVLISTDKAVNPTNIMGASKRFAELILQAFNHQQRNRTRFVMVRFGNVIGSSGSVIPKFKAQIKQGGPVTVTHPEITRFFMTIPEAAQLVIQAGAMGAGGDVFVLDMGESIKIYDLVRSMIRLSGLRVKDDDNPNGDIEIQFTQLRPGEKLYEELLIGDNVENTMHERIMRANENYFELEELEKKLSKLQACVDNDDVDGLKKLLKTVVEGYQPRSS